MSPLATALIPTLPKDTPRWLVIALQELDETETPGDKDNPRILEYHASAPGPGKIHDEVAWCSAFVNWCMHGAGCRGTQSKAARSWLRFGHTVLAPKLGTICVFWRTSPKSQYGHVAFYVCETATSILVLGGNQDNKVKFKQYPKDRLLAYIEPNENDFLLH